MAYKKDTKNEFNKMKDKLKPQKGNQNKPFNFYWIYAIVGLVLISLNLFSFSGGTKKNHVEYVCK